MKDERSYTPDDFPPPIADEPKTAASGLNQIAERLRERGINVQDLKPWGPCEPIPVDELEGPLPEMFPGFRVIEGDKDQSFPMQTLGVAWMGDAGQRDACKHAKQVAIDKYGFTRACTVHMVVIENEDARRRARARELAPKIEEQFPALHREFGELRTCDWNRDATMRAMTWANHIQDQLRTGTGLSIRHPMTGCGKTQLVVAATLEAVRKMGVHAYFVFVPDLLAMSYKDQEHLVKVAQSTDILVLDDLDAGVAPAPAPDDPDSSRSRKIIMRIANARYNAKLPTLWTSNTATVDQLLHNIGDRTLRRLTERSVKLEFGPDAWDWAVWLRNNKQEELPDETT